MLIIHLSAQECIKTNGCKWNMKLVCLAFIYVASCIFLSFCVYLKNKQPPTFIMMCCYEEDSADAVALCDIYTARHKTIT